MTATEYVVLVDRDDQAIGLEEKLAAHQKNLLHRAFSAFVFRQEKEGLSVLLQKRAKGKYHSPGLWTNTCCSHPRAEESVIAAGERRLQEELGFSLPLTNVGSFIYNAHFNNGLSENELDHVLVAMADETLVIEPNPNEVESIDWVPITKLEERLETSPEAYTPWLKQAFQVASKSFKS